MSIEAEVLTVAADWNVALLTNDPSAFGAFVSDDWVYVDPTGVVPKATVVGWIETGKLAHHSMETIGEPRIAIHGDSVILTSRKASTGAWEGVRYSADEWMSEVFIRTGDRWLCVLSHKCPVDR